jgi:uncharacterized protein YceK
MRRTTVVIAIALTAGLALSGCGTTVVDDDSKSTSSPSDMTRENKGTTRKGG